MLKQKIIRLSILFATAAGIISLIYYGYAPSVAPPTNHATLQEITLQVGERQRNYSLYIPKQLAEHTPVVFMLHGSMQSVADIREFSGYQFEQLAEQHGFVLVYPSGYGNHWNDCRKIASYTARTENIDDLGFIDAIRQQLHTRLGTDLNKTFIAGYSNGGQLAFRFALERPNSVAAIAAIAANLPSTSNLDCIESGVAVPVLMMNGSEDPVNPYYGGQASLFGFGARGDVKSAVTSAEYFANLAGYRGSPSEIKHFKNTQANDPTSSKYYAWRDRSRPEVILYTITDGGHVIPQPIYRPPRLLGLTSLEINGPEEIWAFFARQLAKQQ
ncbi:polyhydroxybutyrate depolymerase [Zhongshania antarctica]|uniref:Polyhydroxybutyrate depolymerase n=1 Tax=Zhongshania antarctica TaxID=641702 RepID=A0A840R300_9GAMM|nr:PHB depolymerase family esterase [Zhongshania antarctica]MBB5186830.1 polyhydroxybutyrate depolymerase [Zhongshania antarctica]